MVFLYHLGNFLTFTVVVQSGVAYSPFIYDELAGVAKIAHTSQPRFARGSSKR